MRPHHESCAGLSRKTATERLNVLVVRQGLAESREQAQRLIGAGKVLADGQIAAKPGRRYAACTTIAVKSGSPYVSRGGEKLKVAFEAFGLSVEGLVCLDIGASTGGFTDCLLQHGARRVYAVDVGRGQLHWKMRTDPRVVVMEGVNARYLQPADFPEQAQVATFDVSFISLTQVMPAVIRLLSPDARIVTLIKPQFEAGRREVARGGVVRDVQVRHRVVERIRRFGTDELGLRWVGCVECPLKGPAGNVEYLACWGEERAGRGRP